MKMTNRVGKIHKTYVLVGGGVGLIGGISVAAIVGSPLPILRLLGADALLPPLWIMGILWLAGYILLGAAAGYALACPVGGPYGEVPLWRGLTFLVAEVTFSFAWYSLSFSSFLLFPAWICLALGVAAGVMCMLSWYGLHRVASLVCGGVTLWFLYLAICHLIVILHN